MTAKTQTQNLIPPLLRSFERHLRAENKDDDTIAHYGGATRQFARFAEDEHLPSLEECTREHVELWLEQLREKYAPATVRNRYLGLRAFYDWLAAEGEIKRNPFGEPRNRRIKPPAVEESPKDVVSQADMKNVLKDLEKADRRRDAAIIAILYDTGMRASELADLRMDQLDMETGVIALEHTKGKRLRWVRLSAIALRAVDRYHRTKRPNEDFVICGQREKMTRSGIYAVVRKCFAESKVSGIIGAHDLRHTSASHMAEDGTVSESDMMALYGWKDSDMARHYTEQARMRAALNAHKRASPLSALEKKR